MKKVLLLLNAGSGTGQAKNRMFEILKELTLAGFEVTTYPIVPDRGMTSEKIIQQCVGRFDIIMCVGGDGTLNHVVNSVVQAGIREPIAYLPTGSTNDFARSLGIPAEPEEYCRALVAGTTFDYDIGRFNDRYFNYVAAFGAFTQVSYETNQASKNVLGYAAYLLQSIVTFPESIAMRCHLVIEHDGECEEGKYLYGAVSNTTSIAGIPSPLIRKSEMDDGMFEVTLIQAPDSLSDVREILTALASGKMDGDYVKVFRTDRLHIRVVDGAAWTLDGEYGGAPEEIDISVCPKRIRMIVPEEAE